VETPVTSGAETPAAPAKRRTTRKASTAKPA
jgi:hypothetical protein